MTFYLNYVAPQRQQPQPVKTHMPTALPVTVIIPTYNRRHILERSIPLYLQLQKQARILFIDDGSTDGTQEFLTNQGAEVVRQHHQGLPQARNTGLLLAKTEWVFFGEDDVLIPHDHLSTLLENAKQHPHAAAFAGQLFPSDQWSLPQKAPLSTASTLWSPNTCLGDFAAHCTHTRPMPTLHACALIRRSVALSINGYDTRYSGSAFREESDFYARLWRAGHGCLLCPTTWAIHVRHRLGGGARGNKSAIRKVLNRWSYWRGNSRYLRRHWPMLKHFGAHPSASAQQIQHAIKLILLDLNLILRRAQ